MLLATGASQGASSVQTDFLFSKENIALQWRWFGHFAAAKYFTILMTPMTILPIGMKGHHKQSG
jgi:hypothetical protein